MEGSGITVYVDLCVQPDPVLANQICQLLHEVSQFKDMALARLKHIVERAATSLGCTLKAEQEQSMEQL